MCLVCLEASGNKSQTQISILGYYVFLSQYKNAPDPYNFAVVVVVVV